MLAEAGATGYALLFLVVGGLLRVEYGMPTAFCIGSAVIVVLFGLVLAFAGYAVGVGTMSEAISYSAMALLLLVAAVGFAWGRPSPI